MKLTIFLSLLTCLLACAGLLACSADQESLDGDGRSQVQDGASGFGNANPTAGSGSFGNPDDQPFAGSSVPVSGAGSLPVAGTTGTCGGETHSAEGKPLDIYIIMDESVSMILPLDIWGPTSMALNQFFSSADTAGISAGIAFFSGGCDAAFYATPVVQVAELPGNAGALQMALAARVPGPGTATTPALQGAIMHARQRATDNPDRKQVVLLVTDGEPASCNATIENASAAVAEGLSGTPSIPTYVLGLGNVANLDRLAQAGGTNAAFVVSDPMQVQAVVDAMNAIRAQALPCEYRIPASSSFDKSLVNLSWTREGQTSLIPFVQGAEACDPAQGGWYYDNFDAPTQLVACQQTCDALKTGGSTSVVLGCPQVVVE